MSPQELKQTISHGLLSFPITDFAANGDFRADTYAKRLEWLAPYGATALFAAGGTGEFFSLEPKEYSQVIRTAVDTCAGVVPILAGAGGPTRVAIQYAQEAERLGRGLGCAFGHALSHPLPGRLALGHPIGRRLGQSAVFALAGAALTLALAQRHHHHHYHHHHHR